VAHNPQKKDLKFNAMQGEKSRSSVVQNAIRTELDTGRQWTRVISPDGVPAFVNQLRPEKIAA
jgi:hypothetical protein